MVIEGCWEASGGTLTLYRSLACTVPRSVYPLGTGATKLGLEEVVVVDVFELELDDWD